jgi:cytochrome c peroxidase
MLRLHAADRALLPPVFMATWKRHADTCACTSEPATAETARQLAVHRRKDQRMRQEAGAKPLFLAAACAVLLGFFATALHADEPLSPLPPPPKVDPARVALGERLFDDARLSRDGRVACATCHNLSAGGIDTRPQGRVFSKGVGGVDHLVNTPTVFNAALNFRQQWTGGADSLNDLTDKVVTSKRVFDTRWEDVIARLGADAALKADFAKAYPAGLTRETVMDALSTFQKTLLTPSRFDRYLRGDATAITPLEKTGYERFKAYGCVGCHQGVNIGGNMLQRFGAVNDYFADRVKAGHPLTEGDRGRYNVTHKLEDMHIFKVPSLRNVALTAPYFHDGSAATLEDAVAVMFKYQLGRVPPPNDAVAIVAFLKSLTGEQFKGGQP